MLLDRMRNQKLPWSNPGGIVPLSMLLLRSMYLRLERRLRYWGIGSVNLLFVMVRALRLVFTRKSGIGPETCVPVISRSSSCETLAKEERIGPYRPGMVSS